MARTHDPRVVYCDIHEHTIKGDILLGKGVNEIVIVMAGDSEDRLAVEFRVVQAIEEVKPAGLGARDTLRDEQSKWLKKRQECSADVACLTAAYEERMKRLGEAFQSINRPL